MKYGNLDLQTNEIIVSSVQYRQMANRVLNTAQISRRAGEKFLSDDFLTKTIVMNGHVVSTSTSGLIGIIDNMQKNLAIPQQNLQIDSNRIYVATCSKAEFPELNFTRSTTPFNLEFLSTSPYAFGENLSATFTMPSGVLSQVLNLSISGTAFAEPKLNLEVQGIAGNSGITKMIIEHTNTGAEVVISGTFSRNVESVFNYDNATVTLSGLLVDYTGNFDTFPVGDNVLTITFEGANNVGVSGTLSYLPRFYF